MILHITNDYSGSTVYKNLIKELDNNHIPQIVYTPVKSIKSIDKNKVVLNTKDSEIIYSHILNKHLDRAFYKRKITKILRDIEQKVDMSKIKFIHAHTWYSDGGVAYLLNKKYNIPFIVATRSTDFNVFYKYLLHHRKFGFDILKNTKKIILIGEYQRAFFDKIKISQDIEEKVTVVPNGVDSFWIESPVYFNPQPKSKFKILYVGTFIKRKKLLELQEVIIELSKMKELDCELHIVGGKGEQAKKIEKKIKDFPLLFKCHGRVYDKKLLKEIYNDCHIFAMPSKNETFGLVYVEALLQGLPILYTANEGVDGLYNEKIGEKVTSTEEIKQKLLRLMKNYESYNIPTEKLIECHNWKNIALIYQDIYNKE